MEYQHLVTSSIVVIALTSTPAFSDPNYDASLNMELSFIFHNDQDLAEQVVFMSARPVPVRFRPFAKPIRLLVCLLTTHRPYRWRLKCLNKPAIRVP